MTTSVIICAYTLERWTDIQNVLVSLEKQTVLADEVILVSDYNDELFALAQQAFPNVRVVQNTGSRGLSGARNTGVQLANSDILVFLDDDAVAHPEWLEQLLAAYTEGVVATGGATEPAWDAGRANWFPEEFYWVVGCSYKGMPEQLSPVRNLFGGNMSIKRDVLQQVGGFLPYLGRIGKLPLGGEETELCMRIKHQLPDAEFIYIPQAIIRHRVPASRVCWSYFLRRCYAEGLSKAVIRRLSPSNTLSSEWRYTLHVLPKAVIRNIVEGLRLDYGGWQRAAAIMLGFSMTCLGYVRARYERPRDTDERYQLDSSSQV